MKLFKRLPLLFACSLSLVLLFGCKGQTPQASQAPQVAYVVIQAEEIPVINILSGRLESYRNADVRARVAGVLERRLFEEGSDVKKGDTLFIIDPRSYQASVKNAEAALARAQANFMQADLKFKRYIPLVEINAISRQEFDDAKAAQKQAAADVVSASALLVNARLDLEYATVLAPISGRIGRAFVTEGALVGQGEVTLLANIQQIDPIYLNLTQSSSELLRLRLAIKQGVLQDTTEEGVKITITMEDGTPYTYPATLLFSDISVDPSTGEVSIRARLPNPEGLLLPGTFVRGQIESAVNENAITVPQQAVIRSAEGSSVFIINSSNVAEFRRVKTGASHQNRWVILDGLKTGDKVIVEGLQRVRHGTAVAPSPFEPDKTESPAESGPDETGPDSSDAAGAPRMEASGPEAVTEEAVTTGVARVEKAGAVPDTPKPADKPAAKPAAEPAARPADKPVAQPAARPTVSNTQKAPPEAATRPVPPAETAKTAPPVKPSPAAADDGPATDKAAAADAPGTESAEPEATADESVTVEETGPQSVADVFEETGEPAQTQEEPVNLPVKN